MVVIIFWLPLLAAGFGGVVSFFMQAVNSIVILNAANAIDCLWLYAISFGEYQNLKIQNFFKTRLKLRSA